jgi:hypothetical protein
MRFFPIPAGQREALFLVVIFWAVVATGGSGERKSSAEFIYIQNLSHDGVVVAWGGPGSSDKNGIGETSPPFGPAELNVRYHRDGRPIPGSPFRVEDRNWIEVPLPEPETDYDYRLQVNGRLWGDSLYQKDGLLRFRSFPRPSESAGRLSFLVLGDFGTGDKEQLELADALRQVVDERSGGPSPIRFVLTTGDNIYDQFLFWGTESDDSEYYKKFFLPYQAVLSRVPVFASLGNHDGSESERKEDLTHYRDNFFLPPAVLADGRPSAFRDRFYAFSYGREVRFFCLDTTTNQETLPGLTWTPLYGHPGGSEQRRWLEGELARARETPWKIAWFHHPPYNGGRGHFGIAKDANLVALEAELVPLLSEGGVRVAFSGHVHSFQITRVEARGPLHQTRYIVSGAGGKSERGREGRRGLAVLREQRIDAIHAENQPHFLLVSIEGGEMQITPITYDRRTRGPAPLAVRAADGTEYRGEYPPRRRPLAVGTNGSDESGAALAPLSPYHPIRVPAQPR